MTEDQQQQDQATWAVAEWHGRMLIDRDGEKIGKLEDVYVDVETDEPRSSPPSRKASSTAT
jgi:PRC-barrel domain